MFIGKKNLTLSHHSKQTDPALSMFSFHSSYSWMTGEREAWNWLLSRQDASPSSWTILACVSLNATFRAFPILQDSPSLSRDSRDTWRFKRTRFWRSGSYLLDVNMRPRTEVASCLDRGASSLSALYRPFSLNWCTRDLLPPSLIKHKGQFWDEGTKLWD